ncbi:MAG TPA: glucose 1-dehydrogenase [Chloroflexaceae bacterium]|nr:glucose 1-dehydrogenase [Chloroflexaceae bacterium]
MIGIRGKKVLVTGGSSGIGQAIAVRFAREGADVAINYRKGRDEAEQTRELMDACVDEMRRCGPDGRHIIVQGDVSAEEDVLRMVETTLAELGGLDILINNAGIQEAVNSHEMSAEQFDQVIGVNLRGAFLCAREAIRYFLASRRAGAIVNVSSVHQLIPKPRFLSYSMSKGGMQNLTRTLALEYAGRGIRVNGIGPGATVTPINRAWADDPEKRAEVEQHIPMGRAGEAEEMAAATVFLCSDEAAYITGQTLFIDGGLTLYPDFRDSWSSE